MDPFKAKMDPDQFMTIAQAVRETGRPLTESHQIAEAIHQAFYNQTRYKDFETFKQEYYKRHASKKK